ncbi:DegV family protein with EDD domain [Paenibacillus taihuensis]|uniref:DegV family protein with EDD domain n=1 Tax=Paenibacillus taihuensis TaxID=1156355 RepID=A0A3D9SL31_9BACL|nr:DegV family protein [Paenibacillus taihuensis]REE91630.1 DegV family protein with EDD domain [Paenibacillus taihuensis]
MALIRIVTDSTTDLPKELLQQHQVDVIPLTVMVDEKSYFDNVDITPIEFIHKMKGSKELPKTSQPSIGKFVEMYDRLGANGETIISIHMTSGMSGTYTTACTAAEMSSSNVIVVDSQMISLALGFQVLEAAVMAQQGEQAESIVKRLKHVLDNTSLYVVVESLENLVKGGRVGKAVGWLSSILSIKPIAMLEKGVYTPMKKVRTTSQTIRTLVERFEEEIKGRIVRGIGISHADNLPLAERLQQEIAKLTNVPVFIRPATPVITTHTGAGAIGFMYFMD